MPKRSEVQILPPLFMRKIRGSIKPVSWVKKVHRDKYADKPKAGETIEELLKRGRIDKGTNL